MWLGSRDGRLHGRGQLQPRFEHVRVQKTEESFILIVAHIHGEAFKLHALFGHVQSDEDRITDNRSLLDVARSFVLRNESQMIKTVDAKDKMRHGVIEVQTYQNDEQVLPKIEENLKRWRAQHPAGKKPSVFLLCRYGVKLARGLSEDKLRDLSARWADYIELHEDEGDEDNEEEGTVKRNQNKPQTLYMTMHKSKGLEANYVLILGMFSRRHDWYCFSSEFEDDPLMQLVLSPKEALPDAEERRLFYVALTRAKH